MREVSKEEFFAHVGNRDVHPRCERDASYWELRNRSVIGKTTPGYVGREPRRYYIKEEQ